MAALPVAAVAIPWALGNGVTGKLKIEVWGQAVEVRFWPAGRRAKVFTTPRTHRLKLGIRIHGTSRQAAFGT